LGKMRARWGGSFGLWKERGCEEIVPSGRGFVCEEKQPGVRDDPDSGVPPVRGSERGDGYQFGDGPGGPQ
jgi:hypothetical protein